MAVLIRLVMFLMKNFIIVISRSFMVRVLFRLEFVIILIFILLYIENGSFDKIENFYKG